MSLNLGRLKSHWATVAQFSAWIATIIMAFLSTPPLTKLSENSSTINYIGFATFSVGIVSGIFLVIIRRVDVQRAFRLLIVICTVSFTLGIAAYFTYMHLVEEWSCPYATNWRIVKGDTYNNDTIVMLEKNLVHTRSCEDLLEDVGGDSFAIWTEDSIQSRHLVLIIVHFITWIGFSVAVITITQLLSDHQKGKRNDQ